MSKPQRPSSATSTKALDISSNRLWLPLRDYLPSLFSTSHVRQVGQLLLSPQLPPDLRALTEAARDCLGQVSVLQEDSFWLVDAFRHLGKAGEQVTSVLRNLERCEWVRGQRPLESHESENHAYLVRQLNTLRDVEIPCREMSVREAIDAVRQSTADAAEALRILEERLKGLADQIVFARGNASWRFGGEHFLSAHHAALRLSADVVRAWVWHWSSTEGTVPRAWGDAQRNQLLIAASREMVAVCRRRGLRFKPRGRSLFDQLDRGEPARSANDQPSVGPTQPSEKPSWNPQKRELTFGGRRCLRYRKPAPNGELVIRTFEELGWPSRIDDPFTMGELPKTIESLNRALRKHRAPIQFRGDGNGTGVCWDARAVE